MREALGMSPVEEGFVAIGWHELGDLKAIAPSREAFKAAAAAALPNRKPGAIPGDAGVLYRFSVEMKPGDIIIFPCKVDRQVHIGRIAGPYTHQPQAGHWPNRRKVKWLKALPRASFTQTALHEIGSAITLFRVTTHADEFLAALSGDTPIPAEQDEVSAEEVSAQVEEGTEDFIIKRLKNGLSSYDFERFVGHLLTCMGYHARVTPPSGDGGVDIIAHRDELGFEPPIIKVQCKQMLSNHGRPEVAQLIGVLGQGEHGLFVTLGGFTPEARKFEQSKHNLRLIDGVALVELIFAHYDKFEPRYQVLLPLKRTYVPAPVSSGN
ncbi:restriction endonuclease [Sandarakinorhabdus cyanobacteriorum]|uniref:Restriction endonuclease n=1 Tax=Sandarakinorhabdus cyanobacteriorum TaxID=1981098 RepID=A0A255Y7H5_9SPHN|nr:restriction endonuclease [Sandarakinorhabdus cyanobacteriorum]OYQ25131.1 restriction endonuclease [Sandarakinorhabdus cyanobacteriorum]